MKKTKNIKASYPSQKNKQKIFVTQQGLVEAQDELKYLKTIRREEVAQRLQGAREYGDLSENSEYDAAMEEQSMLENRIAELEGLIKNSQVITEGPKEDFIVIGSTVVVEMDGEIDEFTIVGRLEADPSKKKISNESPVGEALLGAKIGEEVEVATPIVRYMCKVLEIK